MFTASNGSTFFPPIPNPFPIEQNWKQSLEVAPNCPRCASSNTKFCYYNNYSLSQPRYFCKGCRRYWTKGGSLRNVPVGGGCRKSRRVKSSAATRHEQARSSRQSPESGSEKTGPPSESAEIDLAAVFAKFLNQDSGVDPGFSGQEPSCSSNPESGSDDPIIRFQNPCELMAESEMISWNPQVLEGETVEGENVGERSDEFGLQTLLGESGDGIWCDDAALQNLNFSWEPQDLEGIQSDDQLKVSANSIDENWGSFDLSSFELFSRPYV